MSQLLELSDKEWVFPKDTMPIHELMYRNIYYFIHSTMTQIFTYGNDDNHPI